MCLCGCVLFDFKIICGEPWTNNNKSFFFVFVIMKLVWKILSNFGSKFSRFKEKFWKFEICYFSCPNFRASRLAKLTLHTKLKSLLKSVSSSTNIQLINSGKIQSILLKRWNYSKYPIYPTYHKSIQKKTFEPVWMITKLYKLILTALDLLIIFKF